MIVDAFLFLYFQFPSPTHIPTQKQQNPPTQTHKPTTTFYVSLCETYVSQGRAVRFPHGKRMVSHKGNIKITFTPFRLPL